VGSHVEKQKWFGGFIFITEDVQHTSTEEMANEKHMDIYIEI
jgi:hypothetical protein